MQTVSTNYPKIPAYPGEYTPLQNKFEMLAEELSKPLEAASSPPGNIFETPEYYKIELSAPGLKREYLFAGINDSGQLTISALHEDPFRLEHEKYGRPPFNYEWFNREFLLPENIDTDFIKAEYRAGILSFLFLKTERPYQKRVSTIIVY